MRGKNEKCLKNFSPKT